LSCVSVAVSAGSFFLFFPSPFQSFTSPAFCLFRAHFLPSGWPYWANIRLLGDCSLWSVLFDYRSIQNFWASLSHGKSYLSILTKNAVGYILGDFFLKLIWSPCLPHSLALCLSRLRSL
jgi:hypothetical protein